MFRLKQLISWVTSLFFALSLLPASAHACTRFVYRGAEGRVITARSMDWRWDSGTNIWVLPRGVERDGRAGPNSLKWTAKYGSVIASAYDISTTDGMNEAGLVANLLWLADSVFPEPDATTPTLSLSLWAQFMLDNFATVAEAVNYVRQNEFLVLTGEVPGQNRLAALHLSLSDATGDSAILEYVNGELTIHHSPEYQVMTNEPTYDQQLALASYWSQIGGRAMLPGTNRASDRFVRAQYYINAIPETADRRTVLASIFSIIRNTSVPYGISTPEQPQISSTRWRVVADHKDRAYYFESAVSPNIFWVEFDKLDFSPQAGVRTLQLGPDQSNLFSGEE
ncbi:linear amide C-N hydrolase [Leptolyngbya sp. 7M]|uniref:linear amide C-N hydrolase n=1 Tax=Leptolyngbya sp. 7M TaxID=2812896 RepID=UPI001B8D6B06|nr:linear amide C-N hydrolase [Leptolyngbya sp. 7M]QYO67620.1 linear amide C-N hydrolase [Leptolyngbya sp. 7M]